MRTVEIDNDLLINRGGKCYNCSLVEKKGKLFMVYRYEPSMHYTTEVALVELEPETLTPKLGTNQKLDTFRYNSNTSTIDDPRAFMFQGDMHAMCAHGRLINGPGGTGWSSSVVLATFDERGRVSSQYLPSYGRNMNSSNLVEHINATEKNWSPFVHEDQIHLIYSINPTVVLRINTQSKSTEELSIVSYPEHTFDFWRWGSFLAGGTNLIRVGNEFIGLHHTFLEKNPGKPDVRQYYSGLYAISAEAPFRVTRMSSKPVLNSKMDAKKDMRHNEHYWKPNVAYPCGLIEQGDKLLVSYGWQDCRCRIDVWDKEELLSRLDTPINTVANVHTNYQLQRQAGLSHAVRQGMA